MNLDATIVRRRGIAILAGLLFAALAVFGSVHGAAAAPAAAAKPSVVRPADGTPYNCNYTSSRPTISQGSSGAAVEQAQCYLNDSLNPATGHPKLAVDGSFGPKTNTAVHQFQTCAHIHVDGIVGPQTWSYLQAAAESPNWTC